MRRGGDGGVFWEVVDHMLLNNRWYFPIEFKMAFEVRVETCRSGDRKNRRF